MHLKRKKNTLCKKCILLNYGKVLAARFDSIKKLYLLCEIKNKTVSYCNNYNTRELQRI